MPVLRRRRPSSATVLAVAGVLLVAVNLRPAITALGPVLPLIAESTGMGPGTLGALSAAPVVMFAVVSPLVHGLVERLGVDRTIAAALGVLALGTVLRSTPGPVLNLWLGMVLVGATIAVANVTLPVVVKRDFPTSGTRLTGTYVATLSVAAALASGLAVPLAAAGELGWRLSLGVWAVPAVLALAAWLPRAVRSSSGRDGTRTPPAPSAVGTRAVGSIWRSGLAWQLSAYMGLQSTAFYVLLTWLPTVEQDLGVSAAAAGWHLFVMQIAGIAANLTAPVLMHAGRDQRLGAVVPGVLVVAGVLGLLAAPSLVVLWVTTLGLGTGGAFVVALSLMGLRAADPATASRLSAMSQAVGYTLTGAGLVVAGLLRDVTAGAGVLVLVFVTGAGVAVSGVLVGRDRRVRVVP